MRRRYVLVPLLSLIVVINLLEEDKTKQDDRFTVPTVDSDELPDYYMKGMVLKHYDENGELQAKITSPTVSHYASQAQARMIEPEIILFGMNDRIWELDSEAGRIFDDTQDIALDKDVTIKLARTGDEVTDSDQISIVTQQLFYEYLAHRAFSQTEVGFKSVTAEGTAAGLLIDLNTELFELHNNVQIRFND